MKKFLVFLFLFLISLSLFFWITEWVGWEDIKEILFAFSGWEGLVIFGITLLIWLSGVLGYKFIFKSQKYNFSIVGLGEILFASSAISYLFPTSFFGGEAFKVYAIKKRFSLPLEKNLAAVAIEKLLSASIILLFLVSGAISFLLLAAPSLRNFGAVAIAVIGSLTIGLAFFYFKTYKKEINLKWLFRFLGMDEKRNGYTIQDFEREVFRFFDFKKNLVWKGLGIFFFKYFLILIRCWLLLFFLKGETNILIALAILFFIHLAYCFPFPARLGSLEVAQAFAFSSLGMGAASGITFSFLLRGAEVLIALLGLVFLIKLSIKFFTQSKLNRLAP